MAQNHPEDDDDFVSANGDDPREQQEMYEFLDAVSVASPGLSDCLKLDVGESVMHSQICQPVPQVASIFHVCFTITDDIFQK